MILLSVFKIDKLYKHKYKLTVWCFHMIIASDIPVVISTENFKGVSITLIITLVIYSVYILRTKHILMNIIFSILQLFLNFMSMKHAYNTTTINMILY